MVIEIVLVATKTVTTAIFKYQNVLIRGEEENLYKYQLCGYCCSFDASGRLLQLCVGVAQKHFY